MTYRFGNVLRLPGKTSDRSTMSDPLDGILKYTTANHGGQQLSVHCGLDRETVSLSMHSHAKPKTIMLSDHELWKAGLLGTF